MVSGLKTPGQSKVLQRRKGRPVYVKPILKRKPDYFVLHVGTNCIASRKILDKLLQIKTAISDSDENCKIILSQPMTRVGDGNACLTISKLNDLLKGLDVTLLRKKKADYFDNLA